LYFLNDHYQVIVPNGTKLIYRAGVHFKIKTFTSLVFIWKTLCGWKSLMETPLTFEIYGIQKNIAYLEFNNTEFTRYPANKKPIHFDSIFSDFHRKLG
jgi:hypothetical protein